MVMVRKKCQVCIDACFTHVEFRAGDNVTCSPSMILSIINVSSIVNIMIIVAARVRRCFANHCNIDNEYENGTIEGDPCT